MNIVLLGFMGAGKSTVAAVLAEKLHISSVELDEEILALSERPTISAIFSLDGEDAFRRLETQACQTWGLVSPVIVSTGGGVVERSENLDALRQRDALFVFLHTSFSTLQERLEGDSTRPLFQDVEAAKALFQKRLPRYMNAADCIVDTDGKTPEAVASIVLDEVHRLTGNRHKTLQPSAMVQACTCPSVPSATTEVCVIWGDPVSHSLSPRMHNEAYRELDIAEKFVFVAAQVQAQELEQAWAGARAMKFRGITCTIPHKQAMMPLLDELDPLAKKVGAVNTVVRLSDGRYKGYNTDVEGVVLPLKERIDLAGKRVAIVGAGGAARAAVFGVEDAGAEVLVLNRTLEKAQALAEEVGGSAYSLQDADVVEGCDVIVQTTSVGMTPHVEDSPLPSSVLRPSQLVMDAIYTPWETRLLQDARKAGAMVIPGAEMFVYQGVAQFELYTGCSAPVSTMKRIVSESLGGTWHVKREGGL